MKGQMSAQAKHMLIDDLETIRTLLNEDVPVAPVLRAVPAPETHPPIADPAPDASPATARTEADVPLLDDVFKRPIDVDEQTVSDELARSNDASAETSTPRSTPQEDAFHEADQSKAPAEDTDLDIGLVARLFGDNWAEIARDILSRARDAIGQRRTTWRPDDTDELNEALMVRIDETLDSWVQQSLSRHVDELHTMLADALRAEFIAHLAQHPVGSAEPLPGLKTKDG